MKCTCIFQLFKNYPIKQSVYKIIHIRFHCLEYTSQRNNTRRKQRRYCISATSPTPTCCKLQIAGLVLLFIKEAGIRLMEFAVSPAVSLDSTMHSMQWSDANNADCFCTDSSKPRDTSTAHTEDTSLTSLNWLPEFKIQSMDDGKEGSLLAKSSASSIHSTDSSSTGSWNGQESEVEKEEYLAVPLSPIKRCLSQTAEFEKNPLRFEENPNKPPFSYTTIIYLAIRSCNKEKVMLSDIYQWIKDHFKYYRIAESTWQVSRNYHAGQWTLNKSTVCIYICNLK